MSGDRGMGVLIGVWVGWLQWGWKWECIGKREKGRGSASGGGGIGIARDDECEAG